MHQKNKFLILHDFWTKLCKIFHRIVMKWLQVLQIQVVTVNEKISICFHPNVWFVSSSGTHCTSHSRLQFQIDKEKRENESPYIPILIRRREVHKKISSCFHPNGQLIFFLGHTVHFIQGSNFKLTKKKGVKALSCLKFDQLTSFIMPFQSEDEQNTRNFQAVFTQMASSFFFWDTLYISFKAPTSKWQREKTELITLHHWCHFNQTTKRLSIGHFSLSALFEAYLCAI